MVRALFVRLSPAARSLFSTLALAALLGACSRSPAEPDRAPSPASSTSTPAVSPLVWDKPATWTRLEAPTDGPKKASYRIDKTGNDKEDAEVNVYFFGTGDKGDPKKNFKEWLDLFDGDVGSSARRESFDVHGLSVETVEAAGTYKFPVGPPVGPGKKSPMQIVKNGWRLYGAVVRTPDRGNWFFKLTGPDETVQSAKSALRGLLESAR
jgi:hypothetical protein